MIDIDDTHGFKIAWLIAWHISFGAGPTMARRSVADFIPGLALGLGSGAGKAFPLTDPKDLFARHFPYKFTSPLGKNKNPLSII